MLSRGAYTTTGDVLFFFLCFFFLLFFLFFSSPPPPPPPPFWMVPAIIHTHVGTQCVKRAGALYTTRLPLGSIHSSFCIVLATLTIRGTCHGVTCMHSCQKYNTHIVHDWRPLREHTHTKWTINLIHKSITHHFWKIAIKNFHKQFEQIPLQQSHSKEEEKIFNDKKSKKKSSSITSIKLQEFYNLMN